MKNPIKLWLIVALFFGLVACGGGGGAAGGGGNAAGSENPSGPTLGMTAVPQAAGASASVFSKVLVQAGHFFAGGQALAQSSCPPENFKHQFTLVDGTLWLSQAYVIADEVEFRRQPSSFTSPEFGPFALDLTGTDPNVPEAISISVPTENYNGVKFKIKRLEDDRAEQPKNVSNLPAFLEKLGFSGNDDRRPSVWIQGVIGLGAPGSFTRCTPFTFVTDHRWQVTVPFSSGVTADPNTVDAVIFFDLEGAFQSSGVTAAELEAEVGQPSSKKPLGAGFLDGRTKDDRFGTPKARQLAVAFPTRMQLFVQQGGTFSADPTIRPDATIVTDDNPSASDLQGT